MKSRETRPALGKLVFLCDFIIKEEAAETDA